MLEYGPTQKVTVELIPVLWSPIEKYGSWCGHPHSVLICPTLWLLLVKSKQQSCGFLSTAPALVYPETVPVLWSPLTDRFSQSKWFPKYRFQLERCGGAVKFLYNCFQFNGYFGNNIWVRYWIIVPRVKQKYANIEGLNNICISPMFSLINYHNK